MQKFTTALPLINSAVLFHHQMRFRKRPLGEWKIVII